VKLSAFAGAVLGAPAMPMFLLVGTTLGGIAALGLLAAGRVSRPARLPVCDGTRNICVPACERSGIIFVHIALPRSMRRLCKRSKGLG